VIIKEHSILHGTPILGHEILLQEEAVKPAQEKKFLVNAHFPTKSEWLKDGTISINKTKQPEKSKLGIFFFKFKIEIFQANKYHMITGSFHCH
jgi:hypothetical protein